MSNETVSSLSAGLYEMEDGLRKMTVSDDQLQIVNDEKFEKEEEEKLELKGMLDAETQKNEELGAENNKLVAELEKENMKLRKELIKETLMLRSKFEEEKKQLQAMFDAENLELKAKFEKETMTLRMELELEKHMRKMDLEAGRKEEERHLKRRFELRAENKDLKAKLEKEKLEMTARYEEEKVELRAVLEEENTRLKRELERNAAIPCCEVCCYEYNNHDRTPRILSCGHTVCEECVGKLIVETTLTCPFDRNEMLEVIGIGSLPKNFAIIHMIE